MGDVNFYLKKPNAKKSETGKQLIILYKFYKGKRCVISTGQFVEPKNWNAKKQRVKSNATTINDGSESLNDFLDQLAIKCNKAFTEALANGVPSPEALRETLQDYLNHVEDKKESTDSFFKLIDRFISGEIKTKGKDKSNNTLQNYRTVKGHLEAYQAKNKVKLTFEKINLDFFYSFVSFLKKYKPKNSDATGLAQNTIAKDITTLKVFMSEAVDLGFTDNMQFRHKKFTVQETETDAVYLNEKEINAIYKLDLSDNKRLERARDLFVFGCYVGLRFSDYSTIKPENIIYIEGERFIKLITEKTKELVIIPCSPIVLQIFEKYKDNTNSLPRSYSNQNFNYYVKEVCELAGLTETGRLSTGPEMKLFECISSHSARRSFATNLYLDGYPTIEIMKITGHKTEKSFMKYIKVSKLDAAKRLSAFIKKRWSEKMLKVA